MLHKVFVLALAIVIAFAFGADATLKRPRGVALEMISLYQPQADLSWICLDGSKVITFTSVNDDYCDCPDGSDEPGTAACGYGQFYCENLGHRSTRIPSSRVNDGICDCCDGSDEYIGVTTECSNNCAELGMAEEEQRRSEAELHKRGSAKRSEMIAKGKQMKTEREGRRAELERRRNEQEALKAEREELKRNRESAEAEALELYKDQQRSQEPANDAQDPNSMRTEAEASFAIYDTNKDGFVEVTELQVDLTFDSDRNGVVSVEEAKYFLDERDRVDLDSFVMLSWPRIKPAKMLAQGLFKPPQAPEELDDNQAKTSTESGSVLPTDESKNTDNKQETQEETDHTGEEFENDHGEDEEEAYEDEEADVGVGSVEPEVTPSPEYDPETQRLIELANEARNLHAEAERAIREIDQEIKDIDEQNAKDYGLHEEFAALDGVCIKYEDREYVYTLCPFDRASQQQRSGGAETTLGRWDQWLTENNNKYAKQRYSHGASCWNGPQRSAIVQLKCALENRITSVSEPNRCEYFFEFETPAACDSSAYGSTGDVAHDEL